MLEDIVLNSEPFAGVVNRLIATGQVNYNPTVVDALPDSGRCGFSLKYYINDKRVLSSSHDFLSTDKSLFTVEARYATSGSEFLLIYDRRRAADLSVCDTTMFADYELSSLTKRFACSRLNIDGSGSQMITCQREVGSMGTISPCMSR